MLDAALHHDGRMYLSQASGVIHRHHPLARTWSTWLIDLPGLADRDIPLLRSGNGDPRGGGPLWGLTDSGALIARDGGRWRTVAGDQLFRANETPVQHSNLVASARSEDGRYEAYGTSGMGLGVYDTRTKSWSMSLGVDTVRHLAWWGRTLLGRRGRSDWPESTASGWTSRS